MHNWYSIEVEAEFRQQQWQREVAAAARAAQVRPTSRMMRSFSLPRLSWPRLPALSLPRVPVAATLTSRDVPQPAEC